MNKYPKDASSPETAPAAFCWTKMGAEAGEGLAAIIRRKEWERRSGKGVFFWGIGNSLGSAVQMLALRMPIPEVLFSTIRGKPRAVDVAPESIRLWLTYVDSEGRESPLPWQSWVTSRADEKVRETPHYALVCKSDSQLRLDPSGLPIHFGQLRNLSTGKKLGFSQVTSVVERNEELPKADGLVYPTALRAQLAAPFYVRLRKSVILSREQVCEQIALDRLGEMKAWLDWVRDAKQAAWKDLAGSIDSTLEQQLHLRFAMP